MAGNLKPVLKPVYLKIQILMVGAKVNSWSNNRIGKWMMEAVCDKYMEEAREVSDQIAENMEFVGKTVEKFEALQDDLIKTPGPAVSGVSEKKI